MKWQAFAPLGLAVLIALGGSAGRAGAAGGTFRVVAGGDQFWAPSSGGIDQSSSDPVQASGSLTDRFFAAHADYEVASGPGIVRTKLGGEFNAPPGAPFDPSTQAVSTTELTVDGPAGDITTSVNVHVDGRLDAPACSAGASCGALDVEIHAASHGVGSEFNALGDVSKNDLGLAFDAVPGGFRVHGDVALGPLAIPVNRPFPITLTIALGGRFGASGAFSGTFDDTGTLLQVSFAPSGVVLNDVPSGYVVSGPSVVDNHWRDPFAPAGPVDTTPPSVVGVPDREPNPSGWYREPVTIDWRATDDSGTATDPADTVAATDGKDVAYTSGPSCDPAGNCATGTYTVSLDREPPTATCPPPPVLELNAGTGFLQPIATDDLSGVAGGSAGGVPDTSSVGQKSLTIPVRDNAGNTTTVDCGYSVVDTTPPAVVGVPDRQPNPSGWYRDPVTIDWQTTDNSLHATDPADTVAATDGEDVAYASGQSCDPSGNCATGTYTVSLDREPPTATCPPPPVLELNAGTGFLQPIATDDLSGVAGGSAGGVPDTSSVGQKSLTIPVRDNAGNTTTVVCGYVVVATLDTVPPSLTVPPDLTVDATDRSGALVTYTASAVDDRDPLPSVTCAPAPGTVFAIGDTTVACNARDASGNASGARFVVHVRSASEQIVRLLDKTVAFLDLPALRPAFRAALQSAVDGIAQRRPRAACLALDVYAAAVRAAPAAAFTAAERAALLADAARIKTVLAC